MKNSFFISLFLVLYNIVTAQVNFIAHRGASSIAPENTVSSVKLAVELGSDAIEVDVHLSIDNKMMVIHDKNTKRTSGQEFKVSETESDILRTLDVGSYKDGKYRGEKIPFLEEIIKIIPDTTKLVIDIKVYKRIVPFMKQITDHCKKVDQLIFICSDWETILKIKQAYPENKSYWLCSDKIELLEKIDEVSKQGLDGVDLKYTIIDKDVMDKAKKSGLEVIAYTVNSAKETKRLIELGVAGITTDRPGWLRAEINRE
jgi:glycerophosphoryl diester phosphodiesterase